jgi:hypothetical protein
MTEHTVTIPATYQKGFTNPSRVIEINNPKGARIQVVARVYRDRAAVTVHRADLLAALGVSDAPVDLSTVATDKLAAEMAKRMADATVTDAAIQPGATASDVRDARRLVDNTVWRADMPGGYALWNAVDDALRAAERAAEARDAKAKLRGFMAPCPTGYGTVLGHLAQQGREPEDLGLREGLRLARIARDEGVSAVWVESSEALADVCKRVRAYPADFLIRHLGPTDPSYALPEDAFCAA